MPIIAPPPLPPTVETTAAPAAASAPARPELPTLRDPADPLRAACEETCEVAADQRRAIKKISGRFLPPSFKK